MVFMKNRMDISELYKVFFPVVVLDSMKLSELQTLAPNS